MTKSPFPFPVTNPHRKNKEEYKLVNINEMDKQHRNLIEEILEDGVLTKDRTGVGRIKIPGAMMRFDLQKGFPQLGLRHVPYKKGWGEMCAFLNGCTSAAQFRDYGCDYWDQNANENQDWLNNPFRKGEDDLGPVYGSLWRDWKATKIINTSDSQTVSDHLTKTGYKIEGFVDGFSKTVYTKSIDQFVNCVETIIKNPGSSRILFHGWNPGTLDEVALPSCHLLYQFIPVADTLNLNVYIRSNDIVLGSPTNVSQAAFLLHVVSIWTGLKPKFLTIHIGDAHVYANHVDGITQFINNDYTTTPVFEVEEGKCLSLVEDVEGTTLRSRIEQAIIDLSPKDFKLSNYEYRTKIPREVFPMAV